MFNLVKTFSCTKHKDRDALGDRISEWLDDNPEVQVVDKIVTQSSDQEFHCVTVTLFCCRPHR